MQVRKQETKKKEKMFGRSLREGDERKKTKRMMNILVMFSLLNCPVDEAREMIRLSHGAQWSENVSNHFGQW